MSKKKLKIKNSVSKRFKVTKTGKVMFAHQLHGHRRSTKSKSQIRRHKEPGQLTGEFARKIKMLLGV